MSIFTNVKKAKVPRSAFDMSHERKFSMNMGDLVPIFVQEVVPGDKWNITTEQMIRFAPLTAPVMHRINSYIHYFYVPNRIIWKDWTKFITGDLETEVPYFMETLNYMAQGTIFDYMGVPTNGMSGEDHVNALPFRAYMKIWNEYYRDENLQDEIEVDSLKIEDTYLMKRAWEKDYFTSCLPWAQKGGSVNLPITSEPNLEKPPELTLLDGTTGHLNVADTGEVTFTETNLGGTSIVNEIDNISDTEGTIDINDLTTATRLQRWLERNARAGTRYIEHLLAHWGVVSSDQRLQRPEYIGGGKTPITISEVLSTYTTGADGTIPQGNMSGHGISVGQSNRANYYCEEHGFIIGIMSVIPATAYMQSLPKMFSRKDNLDYYYPEFAQLGEQAVLNKEVHYNYLGTGNNDTFGYQSRFAEYKYAQSSVHGAFKSDTMDFWHMARKFSSQPALNAQFIQSDPTTRIFAVRDQTENLWVQLYHNVTAVRPLPFHNTPTIR